MDISNVVAYISSNSNDSSKYKLKALKNNNL